MNSNSKNLNLNSNLLSNMNMSLNSANDYSKLAIYCTKIMNDSTFGQNIVNLIYLKNKFMLSLLNNVKSNPILSQDYSASLRVSFIEITYI